MGSPALAETPSIGEILALIKQYWGFTQLRPLQEEAIRAGLQRRDSLVVLPTGGGKSLCYQVPPLLDGRTDIVISPLISLMKDQVDGLVSNGYPAVAIHSGMTRRERNQALESLASKRSRLALISPERLRAPGFLELLRTLPHPAFAIDEAHCISHWGHDFRPEYRQLSLLKEQFPQSSVHAYTATATERVREDIVQQLRFSDPIVMVGSFDRPNLVYRVIPRMDLNGQLREVLERHREQAVIVYCISRAETERLAERIRNWGFRADNYHAGMEAGDRRRTQDAFSNEEIDVVVATVAFGMGIDRSDVRCVVHSGMPKSIEHYQQETGRAGRDGLEAECVLLFSSADVLKWRSLIDSSATGEQVTQARETANRLLDEMRRYCAPSSCRHRVLVEYFGQEYASDDCQACDVCLQESEALEDGTEMARKVLSCVARVGQRFGVGHVADVLRGADTDPIRSLGHDQLTTYGLLEESSKKRLIDVIYQLVDQNLLERTSRDYPILKLNAASWEVMKSAKKVWLIPTRSRKVKTSTQEAASWQGVDRALFERLRSLRLRIARKRGVPPYLIFSDASLRDMARRRPDTAASFLTVHGVGDRKLADFGDLFLQCIRDQRTAQEEEPLPSGPG